MFRHVSNISHTVRHKVHCFILKMFKDVNQYASFGQYQDNNHLSS